MQTTNIDGGWKIMIKEICEKIGFTAEDADFFEDILAKILGDKENATMFFKAHDEYFGDGDGYHDLLQQLSDKIEVHVYSVHMTFLLYCTKTLHAIYKNKGYSDELFYNSMSDLKAKLGECKELFGIRGTFVFRRWFRRFFKTTLFTFGRLELGNVTYPREGFGDVKQGDLVFDCHIPSGGRLPIEEVYASFKKAYKFFKEQGILKDDYMVITCHSWILNPETVKVFAENSNLKKFASLFEIVFSEPDPDNNDFWRIFGVEFKNFDKAPVDSSLRRNLVEYIKNGGNLGEAYGILKFDGEKVLDFFNK